MRWVAATVLTLPARADRVTVCMNDRCRSVKLGSRNVPQFVRVEDRRLAGPGPVRVRVVLRDAKGRRLLRRERTVTLTKSQPNGPECEPTCWQAGLTLDSKRRLRRTT